MKVQKYICNPRVITKGKNIRRDSQKANSLGKNMKNFSDDPKRRQKKRREQQIQMV